MKARRLAVPVECKLRHSGNHIER